MKNRKWVSISVLIALIATIAVMVSPNSSQAQGNNILPNGGFEGGYYNQDGIPEIAVPLGFAMHWLDAQEFPGSVGLAHRPETVVWNIEDAPEWEKDVFWRDGIYNLKIFKGGAPVYAALSADVNLVKGARYRYTVPIFVDIVNGYNDDGKIAPGDPSWGGVRLGVSELGATWPDASQINYSSWFNSANTPGFYLNMLDYSFEFTAQSNKVTLWAEMFGSQPLPNNGFFLDGLSLVQVSIPPTATPVWPTATPTQPWPTRTPTPWPTKTPLPTSTALPTSTPIPTNTPIPTITPTPLPTGPWFTPTPTVNWQATETAEAAAQQPVVDTSNEDGAATDGAAAAPVAVAAVPPTESNAAPVEGTYVEDGVIYAVVSATDSVWSVAAKNGLTLDEILELNNLPQNDVIFVKQGDILIVGYAEEEAPAAEEAASEEAEPVAEDDSADANNAAASSEDGASEEAAVDTAGGGEDVASDDSDDAAMAAEEESAEAEPAPEPTEEATPEPTATPATAQLCLTAFDDLNQNATRDDGEALRGNVAFTVLNGEAVISNYISDGQTETYCIRGLAPGAYRVTRSKLANEELTTSGEVAVSLTEGAVVDALFGSYIMEPEPEVEEVAAVADSADTALSNDASAAAQADVATPDSNPMNGILIAVAVAAALLLIAILVILLSRRTN